MSQLKTKLYDKRDDFEIKHTETDAYIRYRKMWCDCQ